MLLYSKRKTMEVLEQAHRIRVTSNGRIIGFLGKPMSLREEKEADIFNGNAIENLNEARSLFKDQVQNKTVNDTWGNYDLSTIKFAPTQVR